MAKPNTFIEASTVGTKATIRIVDRISEYSESSSNTIKRLVDEYVANGIQEVEVYINSAGGNVFEATEMCNDLKRVPTVTLKIGSVAASAATYFMTQFPSVAAANSQFMIHRPKLGTYGDVVSIKADLKLLENTTQIYKTAYASKMSKTEDEIESLFAKGDYWMTANEAMQQGLLDAILDEKEDITAESIKLLEAVAAPIIPKINNLKKEEMDKKVLISRLKLSAEATDAEIEAALSALETKASKTEVLEAKATELQNARIEALLEEAIAAKKITADKKDNFAKLLKVDFDGTKAILDTMNGVAKASEGIDPGATASGKENWSLEDYQEKDPEALAKLMVENPEAFKKLEAAYFAN